ncbi:uncharacterized protein LOC121387303 [Gigantopelta aegis]|uniref:uncharacterized protein LOC121387303 n=1 Tax=Gigantopelta aegis TaxID=1735272 RepID=UPI001B88DAA5|nr:uncharacterized protein LOC121387303 [Gigantopelta aegis]
MMREIMDSTSSEHSPPLSENTGSSWANWETEISSVSGLNLGSTNELNSLVEDKEVAARAVAFVVNSTRKGIVPLCADVATLLHTKRRLEKKVYQFKRENEALRSSASISFRTSHSTSPTPPSISSYTDKSLLHDQSSQIQDRSRPCSRCSQCSSLVSNSPKFEKTFTFKGHLNSGSSHNEGQGQRSPHRSPNMVHGQMNGILTKALIHHTHGADALDNGQTSVKQRKNSLPEIISEPDGRLKKIRSTISKEVQCSLYPPSGASLEEQLIETVKLNSKLAEDLAASEREIEILRKRLKDLETDSMGKECTDTFHIESEFEDTISTNSDLRGRLNPTRITTKIAMTSLFYPEPLHGCKCTACVEAVGGDATTCLPRSVNEQDETQSFQVSDKLIVQLGERVIIKGDRLGCIRYVGHLDKIGQPNMIFVGIELDAPVGRNDGFYHGKRYFFCHRDHGMFIPLHDIICKVPSKMSGEVDDVPTLRDKPTWKDFSNIYSSPAPRVRTTAKRKVDKIESRCPSDIENRL